MTLTVAGFCRRFSRFALHFPNSTVPSGPNDGGIGLGPSGDLVPYVGASIRCDGSALCWRHGGKMAGFVDKITGVAQTLSVDDEAAGS
jgi:hypothetical protein